MDDMQEQEELQEEVSEVSLLDTWNFACEQSQADIQAYTWALSD